MDSGLSIVRDEEFEAAVKKFAKTGQDSDAVSGLIAYTSHNENEIYTIDYSNRFTAQVLYSWIINGRLQMTDI